ncbi:MAG: hypothetical protein ACHQ1G_12880 [Planctomycetota bacterium]
MRRLAMLALACGCMPSGEDAEVARAICRFIRRGHGGFPDPDEQNGKAMVWSPGAGGNPGIIVYGITTPEEMDVIEKLAREALHATPGANSVTLAFYDWRLRPEGVHERQSRKLLREVSFER